MPLTSNDMGKLVEPSASSSSGTRPAGEEECYRKKDIEHRSRKSLHKSIRDIRVDIPRLAGRTGVKNMCFSDTLLDMSVDALKDFLKTSIRDAVTNMDKNGRNVITLDDVNYATDQRGKNFDGFQRP
ncbi:histone H4, minor-like [Brevipalpus obovatus]|uniref:histone H4, minor-like n=1 Tax=Brevipalpus obovatus TaxID=246614 RepID=UPI003D9F617F